MHIPDWQLHVMGAAFWLIHALPWLAPTVILSAGAWWLNRKRNRK